MLGMFVSTGVLDGGFKIRVNVKTEMEMASSPMAEPCPRQTEGAWFCIRTHLKHEHIAAAHLERIPGVEVFNPQLRLLRSTRLGRKWFIESLFPNYVFARFALETTFGKITYTPGVKMVLRFGDQMPEISDAVIEDLRRSLAGVDSKVLTDAPLAGEEVEISGGAFAGVKAPVISVLPGKQRAQVLLEVMGRQVPAELSLDLVLFNRRDAVQFALSQVEPAFTAGAGFA
jgi:transcriptional antiterminator RfaH